MLVIAVDSDRISASQVPWLARRHDDNEYESTGEQTAQGLFDAIFHALHDGEQVAIGFDRPLAVSADGLDQQDTTAALAALGDDPAIHALRWLVCEVGTWRPWTIVTTSLAQWRATTSVLIWQIDTGGRAADLVAAIEGFHAALRANASPAAGREDGPLFNIAAAIAVASDATANEAELAQPVLCVPVGHDAGR